MSFAILGPLVWAGSANEQAGAGNTLRQVAYFGCFIFANYASKTFQFPARMLALPISLIITLAWCWLSLTWAIEPSIASRRLILTTMIIWTAFILVETAGFDETIFVLQKLMLVLLVLNYISVATWSGAIHHADEMLDPGLIGNWRGVIGHKNFAGAVCAFTLMIYLLGPQRLNIWLRCFVIIGTVFFLYKTSSKTSMGIVLVSVGLATIYRVIHRRLRVLIAPVLVTVVSLIILVGQPYWDSIIAPFSRSDAFTGRGEIWPALLRFLSDNPWLGSGYGSFWNAGPHSPILRYARGWVSLIASGHNGYLDLAVQIGIPGLTLAVLSCLIIPIVRLLTSSVVDASRASVPLAMLIFCAGHNATESTLLDRDQIVEVLLMFAIALTQNLLRTASQTKSAQARAPLWSKFSNQFNEPGGQLEGEAPRLPQIEPTRAPTSAQHST